MVGLCPFAGHGDAEIEMVTDKWRAALVFSGLLILGVGSGH